MKKSPPPQKKGRRQEGEYLITHKTLEGTYVYVRGATGGPSPSSFLFPMADIYIRVYLRGAGGCRAIHISLRLILYML